MCYQPVVQLLQSPDQKSTEKELAKFKPGSSIIKLLLLFQRLLLGVFYLQSNAGSNKDAGGSPSYYTDNTHS